MSHLGDLLSAHVDGELDGAEQDRVSVHLARCAQCRAEAGGLRALKRQLSELTAEVPGEAEMTARLAEIAALATAAGPTGPARARRRVPAGRVPAGRGSVGRGSAGRDGSGPGGPLTSPRRRLSGRRKYLMLGTMSLVMGLSAVAFTVGGGDSASGPKIVPQVELYSEEHAITTGGVPFDGPGPAMGPVAEEASAATPNSATSRQP